MKIAVLGLILGMGFNAFAADCSKDETYPMVSKAELQKIVKAKSAFIIDVNSEESFKKSHVPGAVHFETVEKTFAQTLPTDKSTQIVAYCGSEMCTAWKQAAKQACEMGYTNIKHFKAGIAGWNKKG